MENIDFSKPDSKLQFVLTSTAEKVFRILLNNKMIQEADRRAFVFTVWPKNRPVPFFQSVIGTTFPDDEFAINCWSFSKEKLERQFRHNHPASVFSRNPETNEYAGSVSFMFNGIEWGFSASGLKEWEDQAISMISPYFVTPKPAFPDSNCIQELDILKKSDDFDGQKNALDYTAEAYKVVAKELPE